MGFLSKFIPNELKGGGWVDYAGTAAGIATGNPWIGAAVGAGGAAYRGNNIALGALQGYGAGNAGASFNGGGLYGWATGATDPTTLSSISGGYDYGGFSSPNMFSAELGTGSYGSAGSLYDYAQGSGGAPGYSFDGGAYDYSFDGSGMSPGSGYANNTGTPPFNPSGSGESLWEQLKRRAMGSGRPGSLGPGTSALNLGSGLYGLYTAAQTRKLAAPGRAAADQLRMLTENPNAIRSYPGYQSGLAAGRQELERSLAKQGQIGGGMAAEAMAKFGGIYDMQYRQSELQRLAQVTQGSVPAEVQANDIVRRALEQISATFRRA